MTRQLIGIPDDYEIYDMMALGWPAYKLTSKKLLRDKEKMVHYDYCGKDDFRTEEEVNARLEPVLRRAYDEVSTIASTKKLDHRTAAFIEVGKATVLRGI